MRPLLPSKLLSLNGRPTNNPVNPTQDMFPQSGQRSDVYGEQQLPYLTTGLQVTRQPQQRVIFAPGSRNVPGHPSLIPTRDQLDQIGAATGTNLPMGSQGMDTSLSGARRRSGRSGRV